MLTDVNNAKVVEIETDGRTVWINVDGVCRMRLVEPEQVQFTVQGRPVYACPSRPVQARRQGRPVAG